MPFSQLANAADVPQKLVITGSSTVAPLISEIAKAFEASNQGVRIDVQSGGSSRGISDARQSMSDIGMISRDLKPEENDLKGFAIAKDGICVILHKNNPITKLEDSQIVDIYTGKIKNWQELGGKDAPITVVNKAEGRSTLELFVNYFKLKNSDIKPHVIIGDNEQGVKTVAGNANAIGYVSIGTAEYDSAQGVAIKLLPIGGTSASIENVKNGKFPLSRNLLLVTTTEPNGLKKKFIEFARSKEVIGIVKQQYLVPITK